MGRSVLTDPVYRSGRLQRAVDDLKYHSAHPTYSVSQNEVERTFQNARAIKSSDRGPFADDEKDLIARLIQDEQAVWQSLLNNKFCQEMKTASSDNVEVAKGLKWYMIQGFLYCARLMLFDTERSIKAPDEKTYEELTKNIESNAGYARGVLSICTQDLQIPEGTVLGARNEWETSLYIEFLVNVATHFDWVASLVAMVPCIQSYYEIATDLKENSTHTDTIWYNYWVLPNATDEYAEIQRAFFVANYDAWQKVSYSRLRKIFREACQREIDLWAIAEEPEDIN